MTMGDLDLFIENHYNGPSHLYQNNGAGTFTDILSTSGIGKGGDRHGSAWADFDNDGDLDLFITYGAQGGSGLGTKQDELAENLGAGVFTNIAPAMFGEPSANGIWVWPQTFIQPHGALTRATVFWMRPPVITTPRSCRILHLLLRPII